MLIFVLRGCVSRLKQGGRATWHLHAAFLRAYDLPQLEASALMSDLFFHLTTLSTIVVLIVLVLGLYTMLKGESSNRSQIFMRWRVGLQFVAIVVIMLAVYFKR
jgi:Mg2+ and Co2+ transporter CorA